MLDRKRLRGYLPLMHLVFPFSALVGQEELKTALILCAVDPSIGGVLIQGEKGTAKTTAVRGLAGLLERHRPEGRSRGLTLSGDINEELSLPPTMLTELPLNATEDRITGSIHLESILKDGTRRFEPGLLARAHGGFLYVDEVNLLESHLVDILLDAAATGVNRVEREGISLTHPAEFILVGTMNPEEGEIRPQFLDRFGFSLLVDGLPQARDREEIIRRRLAFEADPAVFLEEWRAAEEEIASRIEAARKGLPAVPIDSEATARAVELCSRASVAGHRADITVIKGARALAALLESDRILPRHIDAVARYVLPHRIPRSGLEGAREMADKTEELIRGGGSSRGRVGDGLFVPGDDGAMDDPYDQTEIPGGAAAGSLVFEHFKKKLNPTVPKP